MNANSPCENIPPSSRAPARDGTASLAAAAPSEAAATSGAAGGAAIVPLTTATSAPLADGMGKSDGDAIAPAIPIRPVSREGTTPGMPTSVPQLVRENSAAGSPASVPQLLREVTNSSGTPSSTPPPPSSRGEAALKSTREVLHKLAPGVTSKLNLAADCLLVIAASAISTAGQGSWRHSAVVVCMALGVWMLGARALRHYDAWCEGLFGELAVTSVLVISVAVSLYLVHQSYLGTRVRRASPPSCCSAGRGCGSYAPRL